MCSTCGKSAAALPGTAPRNAIVLGEANDSTAQPATFLVDYGNARAGQHKYVTGDGVDAAIADGTIQIGYRPQPNATPHRNPIVKASPEWYVKTGKDKWVGFTSKPAADRYAKTVSSVVLTRDEVLAQQLGGTS